MAPFEGTDLYVRSLGDAYRLLAIETLKHEGEKVSPDTIEAYAYAIRDSGRTEEQVIRDLKGFGIPLDQMREMGYKALLNDIDPKKMNGMMLPKSPQISR